MDLSEISATLREEGAKRGYTSDQINKTLKQIKKGKINLESLAPMLANNLVDKFATNEAPTRAELKKRLSKKINDSKIARAGKIKPSSGDDASAQINGPGESISNGTNSKTSSNVTPKKTKASKNKRLNKLAKKYGTILSETYIESLNYIKDLSEKNGKLTDIELVEKNRHNNIIKIYEKQTNIENINFSLDCDDDGDDVDGDDVDE